MTQVGDVLFWFAVVRGVMSECWKFSAVVEMAEGNLGYGFRNLVQV